MTLYKDQVLDSIISLSQELQTYLSYLKFYFLYEIFRCTYTFNR